MTHVVVVGSGIAGITAALHAAASCEVTLVTKAALDAANTTFAQGGVAAALFEDDSPAAHARDTLAAGAGLGDPAAVDVLTREGPERVRELRLRGVAFDRDAAGDLARGLEAAHSHPRVVHAGGDATGRVIEHALIAALRASGVRVIEHAFLLDLVVDDAARVGGVALLVAGRRDILLADAVILATGGAGQLYAHTTNPAVATGDGIAAALRAGAAVSDLEFVQFHPTVLAVGEPFLVSEAVRGEGATIIDDDGRRFLFDAHPDGELAARDVVARAIAQRMTGQNGRPVRLDATRVGASDAAAFLPRRFPTIDAAVGARGLDWAHQPIPVTPAAHYLMGGITTDLHGRTSLPGLYAVGECARTGVHGANRLASNSLLEAAVFGARAGDAVVPDAAAAAWPVISAPGVADVAITDRAAAAQSPAADAVPFSRAALQRVMWEQVGLARDAVGLARAAQALTGWAVHERTAHTVADHEDENLLLLARAVAAAATARTSSVGAHFRTDAPAAITTHPILAPAAPEPVRRVVFASDRMRSEHGSPLPARLEAS
jgi:L-aspartate oxidase